MIKDPPPQTRIPVAENPGQSMPAYVYPEKPVVAVAVEREDGSTRSSVDQPSRLPAMDAARLFATFSIVWVHVWESHGGSPALSAVGRFGTSFYILAAALFAVRGALKTKPRSFGEEVSQKSRRLLWPYLIWSLLYGVVYAAIEIPNGATWSGLTQWWGPVAGTAIHLWFLPFVFVWGTLASVAAPRLLRLPLPVLITGGVVVSGAVYFFCYRWLHFALSRYWLWEYHLHRLDRWIDEVPPFVAATLGAVAYHRLPSKAQKGLAKIVIPIAIVGAIGFFATEYVYATRFDVIKEATATEGRFLANIAALFLLASFLALNRTAFVKGLAPVGKYTYLAFLSHMLVLEMIRGPIKAIPGYGSIGIALSSSVFVFAGSLALSWLIQNVAILKPLRV